MVKSELDREAARLANRPYSVEFTEEPTVDGRRTVIVARHQELPGCMAQGASRQEAEAELSSARLDFIESLLESGLPVPEPRSQEHSKP
jgi:predicted RNase H-like HicB family nuclease